MNAFGAGDFEIRHDGNYMMLVYEGSHGLLRDLKCLADSLEIAA